MKNTWYHKETKIKVGLLGVALDARISKPIAFYVPENVDFPSCVGWDYFFENFSKGEEPILVSTDKDKMFEQIKNFTDGELINFAVNLNLNVDFALSREDLEKEIVSHLGLKHEKYLIKEMLPFIKKYKCEILEKSKDWFSIFTLKVKRSVCNSDWIAIKSIFDKYIKSPDTWCYTNDFPSKKQINNCCGADLDKIGEDFAQLKRAEGQTDHHYRNCILTIIYPPTPPGEE